MAIIADLARTSIPTARNDYTTTMGGAMDASSTEVTAAVAETHVNFAYEAPTNNTGDAWVPIVNRTFETV